MRMETSSPPPLLSQNSASFTIYLFDHRITNSWKSGQRGPVFEIKGVSIIPEFALNIERKITFILFAGESWKFFFEIFIIRILSRETRGVSSNSKRWWIHRLPSHRFSLSNHPCTGWFVCQCAARPYTSPPNFIVQSTSVQKDASDKKLRDPTRDLWDHATFVKLSFSSSFSSWMYLELSWKVSRSMEWHARNHSKPRFKITRCIVRKPERERERERERGHRDTDGIMESNHRQIATYSSWKYFHNSQILL